MPANLRLSAHLQAVEHGAATLRDSATRAGPTAVVVTCPGWTVTDLVTHVGIVHRWAVAQLRGAGLDEGGLRAEAARSHDLMGWFDDGVRELLNTLKEAPDDVKALVFLQDAPPPRRFWARRQAHETTVHGVDVLAARLARLPSASEASIPSDLAADGIDELLTGFVPRRSGELRSSRRITVQVHANDTGDSWTLEVGDRPVATTVGTHGDPDAVLTGSAAQLYLGLWNRGDEIEVVGQQDVLELWRSLVRVTWS